MRLRHALAALFLLFTLPLAAETLVNWENGFEVDIPDHWLRRDAKEAGLLLNSEDVSIKIEPYSGVTLDHQIERLHKKTKADQYEFKDERTFTVNQVPTQEMVFFKDGEYRIYYVMMSGQRGFLWTVKSDSTDSEAFLEGQDILTSFRVIPVR